MHNREYWAENFPKPCKIDYLEMRKKQKGEVTWLRLDIKQKSNTKIIFHKQMF